MERNAKKSLDGLFRGDGVAILGASAKRGKPGNSIVENIKNAGYTGNVYPVSLTSDSILGFKCYRTLEEISGRVDMVVMVLPSDDCVEAAKAIARRKDEKGDVSAVVVVSAGFSELGTEEGRSREKALLEALVPRGIRVVGPNCLGVIDTYSGINTNFDIGAYRKGGLSIITQSGAFAASYLKWAEPGNLVGLNKFVSLGNMSDVNVVDLLGYLADDERTNVIALYLEGTKQGRALIEAAAEVSRKKAGGRPEGGGKPRLAPLPPRVIPAPSPAALKCIREFSGRRVLFWPPASSSFTTPRPPLTKCPCPGETRSVS